MFAGRVELPVELPAMMQALETVDVGIDDAADLIAPILTTDLQQNSGESGRFKTGWGAEPLNGGGGLEVTNNFPMAAYVEYPTVPHVIFPKRAGGVLSWVPRAGGFRVFAKWVLHPGFKGRDVFNTTLDADVDMISSVIFKSIVAHLGG